MPKNPDIKKVLVIGSGPIIIGQAAEFDYAGTQACRAIREEGVEVVLINSNPATIMTDKQIADKVYIEPLTVETIKKVIIKEKPDSILPTLGGQNALNLAVELEESYKLAPETPMNLVLQKDRVKVGEEYIVCMLTYPYVSRELKYYQESSKNSVFKPGDPALKAAMEDLYL